MYYDNKKISRHRNKFYYLAIIIFNIVIHINSNQAKTYNDVVLETLVTRNSELGPSVYVDVSHEVSNLDLFVESKPRSINGFYGYEQSAKRYNHKYLEIMYANNLAGTDQYIIEDSIDIEIIYEEYTFEVSTIFGVISDYKLIDIATKNESIHNNEYVETKPCDNTKNCIIFNIDLNSRFIEHDDYQLTTIDELKLKQISIPKIIGYSINYSAKLNHLSLYPEQSSEGSFGIAFEVEQAFFTN
ncbi:MAG: hypothetical protein ACOCVF_03510 [bacterium]